MYDSIEEIDEQLEKLRKRKEKAKDLIDMNTYGGLVRGSVQRAGIREKENELLRRREQLLKRGKTSQHGPYFEQAGKALDNLAAVLAHDRPEEEKRIRAMIKELKELRSELD
ncbi:hypothetical protein EF808_01120 [archaeon]|nr:MAG: hypothetical protein EF808_01120 [archaeon]